MKELYYKAYLLGQSKVHECSVPFIISLVGKTRSSHVNSEKDIQTMYSTLSDLITEKIAQETRTKGLGDPDPSHLNWREPGLDFHPFQQPDAKASLAVLWE